MTAGYISLSTFPNEAGPAARRRLAVERHRRSGPETTGQPGTGGYGQTISGELEQSNVDMATEFTNMIEAERGYQANSQHDHHGRPDDADARADEAVIPG